MHYNIIQCNSNVSNVINDTILRYLDECANMFTLDILQYAYVQLLISYMQFVGFKVFITVTIFIDMQCKLSICAQFATHVALNLQIIRSYMTNTFLCHYKDIKNKVLLFLIYKKKKKNRNKNIQLQWNCQGEGRFYIQGTFLHQALIRGITEIN